MLDASGHRLAHEPTLRTDQTVTLIGEGFQPGSAVEVGPDGVVLPGRVFHADGSGRVHASATMTALPQGEHVLALIGAVPGDTPTPAVAPASTALIIAGVPEFAMFRFRTGPRAAVDEPGGSSLTGLAFTGPDIAGGVAAGVSLVVAGAGVLTIARRRTRRA